MNEINTQRNNTHTRSSTNVWGPSVGDPLPKRLPKACPKAIQKLLNPAQKLPKSLRGSCVILDHVTQADLVQLFLATPQGVICMAP
jgi:hypothetical protein